MDDQPHILFLFSITHFQAIRLLRGVVKVKAHTFEISLKSVNKTKFPLFETTATSFPISVYVCRSIYLTTTTRTFSTLTLFFQDAIINKKPLQVLAYLSVYHIVPLFSVCVDRNEIWLACQKSITHSQLYDGGGTDEISISPFSPMYHECVCESDSK